jgi:hypothetical protein
MTLATEPRKGNKPQRRRHVPVGNDDLWSMGDTFAQPDPCAQPDSSEQPGPLRAAGPVTMRIAAATRRE